MAGTPWTDEARDRLRRLVGPKNCSWKLVAEKMGRTIESVRNEAGRLGLRAMGAKRWSVQDDAVLTACMAGARRRAVDAGVMAKLQAAAQELGRGISAVKQRWYNPDAAERAARAKARRVTRKCLRCREEFESGGNRICPPCTIANESASPWGVPAGTGAHRAATSHRHWTGQRA